MLVINGIFFCDTETVYRILTQLLGCPFAILQFRPCQLNLPTGSWWHNILFCRNNAGSRTVNLIFGKYKPVESQPSSPYYRYKMITVDLHIHLLPWCPFISYTFTVVIDMRVLTGPAKYMYRITVKYIQIMIKILIVRLLRFTVHAYDLQVGHFIQPFEVGTIRFFHI